MEQIPIPTRPEPIDAGPERAQLESWLDFHRATLLIKCAELDLDGLRARPAAPSDLSLLGILRHMTYVEQAWFQRTFAGLDVTEYYKLAEDRDSDFHDLDSHTLAEVVDLFLATTERSRVLAAGHDLDEPAAVTRHGRRVDLRWIFLHMIEEYARHNGHADLLRELIDGRTGD